MNPIYEIWLKQYSGLPLYEYIIWVGEQADNYKKEINQPFISDHIDFVNWIKRKAVNL